MRWAVVKGLDCERKEINVNHKVENSRIKVLIFL